MFDGLHEDLNKVRNKPATQEPNCKGKSDQEASDIWWKNNLKRNNSIIMDTIGGQYKSTVQCPDCEKISISFDPFLMISVPIPFVDNKRLKMFFIPLN